MERNPVDVFFHKSQIDILLAVDNTNITEISKNTHLTYTYVVKKVKEFEKLGLVSIEKRGRDVLVELTKEGMDLAKSFEAAVEKLERVK